MALKKTDKIIAIIGVLILIIAGIGIFLYVGTEETSQGTTPQEKIYVVNWEEKTGTLSKPGDIQMKFKLKGKQGTYSEPFDVSTAQGNVITKVVVSFNWTDSRQKGRGSADTFTATITPAGGEAKTHTSVGSADESKDPLTFSPINANPQQNEEITDASSMEDAKQKVMDEYASKNTVSFKTDITLKAGEKLGIRPLKLWRYHKENGDSFTIEITYTYSIPSINEVPIDGNSPPVPPQNSGLTLFQWESLPGIH